MKKKYKYYFTHASLRGTKTPSGAVLPQRYLTPSRADFAVAGRRVRKRGEIPFNSIPAAFRKAARYLRKYARCFDNFISRVWVGAWSMETLPYLKRYRNQNANFDNYWILIFRFLLGRVNESLQIVREM